MGYETSREVQLSQHFLLDILAQKNDEIAFAIDVKLVTENPATLSELRNITSRSKALLSRHAFPAHKVLLIVSCFAEPEHISWLEAEFGIKIWDRHRLKEQADRFRRLSSEIDKFFREFQPFESSGAQHDRRRRSGTTPNAEMPIDLGVIEEAKLRASELCSELHGIPAGKKGAKQYERLITDIINYLFDDYLVDPRPQNRLEDRLSILDIIYRVRPGHPFWDTLTRDFRARVMVFECKNYSQPIQPDQIYSTERYVSAGALRPICFLVTRKKPHKHAELAAFGAMREGGKLFIFLDDQDICEMLTVRDVQLRLSKNDDTYFENDPTVVLDQKIYDFLGRMPR
jgi:hypothetical protein